MNRRYRLLNGGRKRMKQSLTRRQFLKTTAIGAAAAYLSPSAIGGTSPVLAEDLKQRVIIGSHRNLVDASEQIVPKIVRAVVDDTLVALTNTASARDAWLQLLPNLQSHDVIGIKVNCINRRQSSHPPVVYALAESLIESLDFNPNHLLIWDRTSRELKRAHYTINTGKTGVRCLGTSDGIGYDESFAVDVGNDREVHLSKILTEMCTYLINVPVLKDHGIAGITLSLKNHYGSIDRPGVCHGGGCDPYAAHLNATPHIKDKTALILCDALFGIYRGGPGGSPQWINRQLLASVDPVALDYTGMTIIDHQRQQRNISLA
ncbi:DUF362 domain-containing protein, partial [candidate division KSB3 bacterium]|nr:DUF362 domain-containing protein [candidate division KSB3 bacterium]MBD3325306.1 DUF362 domain-containing protein [candidate division KSB3 bacterium]